MPPPAIISQLRGKCPSACLAAIILLAAVYGITGYDALLSADSWTYVRYAQTLARGTFFDDPEIYAVFRSWWPSAGRLDLQSGLRHMVDEKIYFGYEPGFPLLLAAAIRLAGFPAVFFVNPLLLLVLSAFMFWAVRLVFASDPDREGIAFLSLALMFLIPPERLQHSATKVLRDIPALTFMVVGLYCLLRGCRSRPIRGMPLFLAVLFLGGAAVVRFNYLPNIVPGALFLTAVLIRNKTGRKEAARAGLAFGGGIALLIMTVMVLDLLQHRNPFMSVLNFRNVARMFAGVSQGLFSPRNLATNGQWYLGFLWRTYAPALMALALLGLAASFRERSVSCLLFPIGALQLLIYSGFVFKSTRYLLPVYCILSIFASAGIFRVLRVVDSRRPSSPQGPWPRFAVRGLMVVLGLVALAVSIGEAAARPESRLSLAALVPAVLGIDLTLGALTDRPWRRPVGALILTIAFVSVAATLIAGAASTSRFQIADIERLRGECERYIPRGSLVLAASNFKQNVDIYTSSTALTPYQLAAPWGLTSERAVAMVLESGTPVFGFDNRGSSDARMMLDNLENYFDLVPVAEWKSRDLKIDGAGFSERDILHLFRLLPWSARETACPLNLEPGRDYLLAIHPRRVWWDTERKTIEVYLDDQLLRGRVADDLTFVSVAASRRARPGSVLRLRSDRGLPASLGLGLSADPARGLMIDVGRKTSKGYPDGWFLPEGFVDRSRSGNFRSLWGLGRIALPPFSPPGMAARVRLRVRNRMEKASALNVELTLDGDLFAAFTLPVSREWRVEEALLPPCDQEVGRAWLGITPCLPSSGTEIHPGAREAAGMDIDWLSVEWTRPEPGSPRPPPLPDNQRLAEE
jgi:hypothetical protein